MYEDRRETFTVKDVFLQLLFIVLLVFILIWLFPTKGYLERKLDGIESSIDGKLQPLYTRLFTDNIITMKDAAKSYFTNPRLPQNVGDKVKLSLSEMYEKGLLLELVDSNNKSCDATKSYVEVTKMDEEYQMKVTLSCSDKEAYIIEYMGCYDYCNGLCTKEEAEIIRTGGTPTPTPSNDRYRYQYVLTTGGSCSKYGSWSDWTTNRIEENSNTKVETKTEKEVDYYEKEYKVVDTKYVDEVYYEDVYYGYSTKTIKKTTIYNYTTTTTNQVLNYGTKTEKKTTVVDFIYKQVATGVQWVDAGTVTSHNPLSSSSTVTYDYINEETSFACTPDCATTKTYYYRVKKAVPTYTTVKECPANTTPTDAGCVKVDYVTSNYCPTGDNNGSGCVVTNTEKKCAQGRDTGSGCEVIEYVKQNYCSSNGKDTGSGCVVPVKKTKKVAQLVYGWVEGSKAVYKNVTYYRSASRTCTGATVDYKWSESNNDASLKAQGYTLTGVVEKIK